MAAQIPPDSHRPFSQHFKRTNRRTPSSEVNVLVECLARTQLYFFNSNKRHSCISGTAVYSQAKLLQVIVILLLNPANSDAQGTARKLTESLARVLFVLKARPRKLLVQWLSQLPAEVLGGRCIRPLQMHLTKYIEVRTLQKCCAVRFLRP